jgi:hypothetical protein
MAYRRVYTRVGNSPVTTFPTAIKAEFDRLVSEGIVTRTETFVTSPAELIEQNIGANQFKSTVTEVWRSQEDFRNYRNWTDTNYQTVFNEYISTHNIVQTIVSAGEI